MSLQSLEQCCVQACQQVLAPKGKQVEKKNQKKTKRKRRHTETNVSEEDTRDRPGLKNSNDFSWFSVLELCKWKLCCVTCFVCLARH